MSFLVEIAYSKCLLLGSQMILTMTRNIIFWILCSCSISLYAQIEMGNDTDYSEIEQDGTLEFHGNAKVWNDYVVPFSSVKTKATKTPTWESFMGDIHQYAFGSIDASSNEHEVGFVIQLPHDWDSSPIYPHIHWSPANDNAGSVVWAIDYTWVNYNASSPMAFPTVITSITTSQALSNDGLKHLITAFDPIVPSSDQNDISSILVIRFYRNSSNAEDDYNAKAFALSFDIHYRSNTTGSREEYIK